MAESYTRVDLTTAEPEPSKKSGTPTLYLTDALGTTEMRASMRVLPPHTAMFYHHQDQQEEVYLLFEGSGGMMIDDERVDADSGTIIRVSPKTPRQLFNDSDDDATWLIFGAPPIEHDGTVIGSGPAADVVND